MKLFWIIPTTVVMLLFVLYFLNRTPTTPIDFESDDYILVFSSPTCPHCQNVKDHINTNQLDQKLPIKILDLSTNRSFSQLLADKAKTCQIDSGQIGIPFYYYQNQCLQGDQPIINALDQMLE